MSSASHASALATRAPGPRPLFTGKRLEELLDYLGKPESTLGGAATKFRCSKSTVEKTLRRLRAQAQPPMPRKVRGYAAFLRDSGVGHQGRRALERLCQAMDLDPSRFCVQAQMEGVTDFAGLIAAAVRRLQEIE